MSIDNSPFTRIKRPLKSDMNVVPYIDVMLVLLVIFMVTAPMLTTGVEVNLPNAESESLSIKQELPAVISLKADGQMFISRDGGEDKPVDEEALVTELNEAQTKNPQLAILINADKDNLYGQVIVLMSMLQQSGIKQVGLLTESPKKS